MRNLTTKQLITGLVVAIVVCAVLLLGLVGYISSQGGSDAGSSAATSAETLQAQEMRRATDMTPWVFSEQEAYDYGKRACKAMREGDKYGGYFGGSMESFHDFYGGPSDAYTAEEQIEFHKFLHTIAARTICTEQLVRLPERYR